MAKILIVADNEQLGKMLVERLARRGAVMLAEEAASAVARAKAAQPDVILLDAPLRGDGDWATARALKFDELTRSVPLIGLMAHNSESASTAAMQSGCDELVNKPRDFHLLLRRIDAVTPAPVAEADPE